MDAVLGTSLSVFLGLTVLVFGLAAFLTGQALANAWKPVWQLLAYCLLLGLANRFLTWGLFKGHFLSLPGFLVGTAAIAAIAYTGFRLKQVWKFVNQYPWLYQRTSPWSFRRKTSPSPRYPTDGA